ncbi:MAG: PhoH family protein, partial [Richelia sp. RM2_1_2]|nr:PhoH family protein [Richelia sp. RM2_1_2]
MTKTKAKNRKAVEESFSFTQEDVTKRAKDSINRSFVSDIKITAKNESQRKLIKSIKEKQITICAGLPGSGKTFISLGMALQLLKNAANNYRKIYMIKSVTTLKGEEVGFLKGDLNEKIEPFMWSFFLNVEKLVDEKEIRGLFSSDIIRPFP